MLGEVGGVMSGGSVQWIGVLGSNWKLEEETLPRTFLQSQSFLQKEATRATPNP